MKKSLLAFAIILVAFAPCAVHAQYNFPLNDLQKMTSKNPSDFETFVMGKDYSIQSKLSNNVTKVYTSDKPGPLGKQYTITRYQVPNAMTKVTFVTTDKKFYLDVKTHLAASGLKFVKEENKTIDGAQAVCSNFANGALQVSLCSYTTDVTWFKIEVHF